MKYTMVANGDGPQSNQPADGPTSGHPYIVNHLFADGSAHCLSKQIDVTAYMFLITRSGHDSNSTLGFLRLARSASEGVLRDDPPLLSSLACVSG